jgi:hypothetical protein
MKPFTSILIFCYLLCSLGSNAQENEFKIDGITLVAPPQPIQQPEIDKLKATGAEWICLVPYAFQKDSKAEVSGGLDNRWWGENRNGITQCIEMAREAKLKIMLKPQVWMREGWVGDVSFKDSKENFNQWGESYKEYIISNAKLAETNKVEILCVGTEFDLLAIENDAYWRQLISNIRKVYKGKLVYSANWDKYDKIKFWDQLDYIGISGYFPLTDLKTPTVAYLSAQWKKQKRKLESISKNYDKQILFTEYGYLSVDKCADKTWELERNLESIPVNEDCQSNAYESLFSNVWKEKFIVGGFLWKWFSYAPRREGSREKEYDPQNKLALETLKKYYAIY